MPLQDFPIWIRAQRDEHSGYKHTDRHAECPATSATQGGLKTLHHYLLVRPYRHASRWSGVGGLVVDAVGEGVGEGLAG